MKSFTKSLLLLVILLLIVAPAAFAQEAAPAIPANSITGIAVADGRFDTLAANFDADALAMVLDPENRICGSKTSEMV